jgi:polyphosphate glucokinase
MQQILGIDIGGSSIKGAPVNLRTGRLAAERLTLPTEPGQSPEATIRAVCAMARHFAWQGRIGIGFPGSILDGRVAFLGNLSQRWVGVRAARRFGRATGCPVAVLNDADAAGLAEMRFGAGRGARGTVLMLTAGTGIGSALFREGVLVPNLELGQVPLLGRPAEKHCAASVRTRRRLSWPQWAGRFNRYLTLLEGMIWPDLIIIGGGVSRDHRKWFRYLRTRGKVVPARLHNDAGLIGAALAGAEQ